MASKRIKLTLSGLILSSVIAIASLGVSAAWYGSATQLRVEVVNVAVSGEKTLKISSSPDLSSFQDHKIGQEGDKGPLLGKSEVSLDLFKPVSSMFTFPEDWHKEASWLQEKKDKPSLRGSYQDTDVFIDALSEGIKRPQIPDVADSGYYSQTLYLLCDTDAYVTFDPDLCFFNGYTCKDSQGSPSDASTYARIHEQNLAQANKLKSIDAERYAKQMDGLYQSVRISLLDPDPSSYKYTIIDPFKKETPTYFAGPLNMSVDRYYDNYFIEDKDIDRDGKKESLYREIIYGDIDEATRGNALYTSDEQLSSDRTIYDEEGREVSGTIEEYEASSFYAYTKPYTYHFLFSKSLKENRLKAATEKSVSLASLGGQQDALMIPVYRNKPKKIVLSMYLEGWDEDCVNNTMGAFFSTALSFKIAREM